MPNWNEPENPRFPNLGAPFFSLFGGELLDLTNFSNHSLTVAFRLIPDLAIQPRWMA